MLPNVQLGADELGSGDYFTHARQSRLVVHC